MVYVDTFTIKASIQACGLEIKYPLIKKDLSSVAEFMLFKTRRSSGYQRIARKFFKYCNLYANKKEGMLPNNTQMPFSEYINKKCIKEMYIFRICAQYDLADFQSSKFVSDFCGKPIDKIAEHFDFMNMRTDTPYLVRNNTNIYDIIKKICSNYLVVTLAKVFAAINLAMQTDTLNMLSMLYGDVGASRIIQKHIVQCLRTDGNIEQSINSKFLDSLQAYIPKNNQIKIKPCTISIYNQLKKIYYFMTQRNNIEILEYCQKNPDFAATIGTYLKDNTSCPSFTVIYYTTKLANLFLANFLENTEPFDGYGQIKNLKIPDTKMFSKIPIIEV